jgi:hypothetical protein
MKHWRNNRSMRGLLALTVVCATVVTPPQVALAQADRVVGMADLTPEVERAIDRGLVFLAQSQQSDGSWGGPAQTSLALMAFMLKGYFPDPGRPDRYGKQLELGLRYLLSQSEIHGGYLGGNMYHHALGTLALAEIWGMSPHPEIRQRLKFAVEVTLRAQNEAGGWRYQPVPVDADTSVTAMVVVSLAAAHEAGILVPAESMDRAMRYITGMQVDSGGFAYTQPRGRPGFPRSAACVLALQLGGRRDSDAVARGLAYLWQMPADEALSSRHFAYAQYYAVQAMYQAGEDHYQRWYPGIREILLRQQRDNGSWDGQHGAAYNTAMAILVLGVPYRYLPIYQR